MSPEFTDDDIGKTVVNANGEEVGIVADIEHGTAHVEPDPGIADTIKAKLGWGGTDDDAYPLQEEAVTEVTSDEIRLERDLSGTGGGMDTGTGSSGGMDTDTGSGGGMDTDTGSSADMDRGVAGGAGTSSDMHAEDESRGVGTETDETGTRTDTGRGAGTRDDNDSGLMDDDDELIGDDDSDSDSDSGLMDDDGNLIGDDDGDTDSDSDRTRRDDDDDDSLI